MEQLISQLVDISKRLGYDLNNVTSEQIKIMGFVLNFKNTKLEDIIDERLETYCNQKKQDIYLVREYYHDRGGDIYIVITNVANMEERYGNPKQYDQWIECTFMGGNREDPNSIYSIKLSSKGVKGLSFIEKCHLYDQLKIDPKSKQILP